MPFILMILAIRNAENRSKKKQDFVITFLRNPRLQVELFFIARCVEDAESIGIGTIGICSVVCVLLILSIFRAVLDHCAAVSGQLQGVSLKIYFIKIR